MNISFALKTQQIRNQTAWVTRRVRWLWLVEKAQQGLLPIPLMAIEKGQGLKKGEHVVKICPISVIEARREPLRRMVDDLVYGFQEVRLEGFPDMHPALFVRWFEATHKCSADEEITRIEFEYVQPGGKK